MQRGSDTDNGNAKKPSGSGEAIERSAEQETPSIPRLMDRAGVFW